jgi:hypothetical protein
MPDTPQSLSERLRLEGNKTVTIFRQLEPKDWEKIVYAAGESWSIRQLLAHFVTAEAGIEELIKNILEDGEGVSKDFDIDRFNSRQVSRYLEVRPEMLIRMFSEQRERTVELVESLQATHLDRVGRHPFLGMTSLEDMIKLIYRHNQIHQRDMRRAIDAAT